MALGSDLMQYRRGIDALKPELGFTALSERGAYEERAGERKVRDIGSVSKAIGGAATSIFEGIRTARRDAVELEEKSVRTQLTREQTKGAQIDNAVAQMTQEDRVRRFKADADSAQANAGIAQVDLKEKTRASGRKIVQEQGDDEAWAIKAENDPRLQRMRKPKGWAEWNTADRAAWARSQFDIEGQDAKLDQTKAQTSASLAAAAASNANAKRTTALLPYEEDQAKADLAYKKMQTAKSEVELHQGIQDLAKAGDLTSSLRTIRDDPSASQLIGVDLKNPAVERQQKEFYGTADKGGVQRKLDSQKDLVDLKYQILKSVGVKIDANGNFDPEQAEEVFSKFRGVEGSWRKLVGDEEASRIDMMVTRFSQITAKEGTYGAVNREYEIKLAQLGHGGNPGVGTHTEAFIEAILGSGEGKTRTFVGSYNTDRDTLKRDTLEYLNRSNGARYVNDNDYIQLQYNLLPPNTRLEPGTKDSISYDSFKGSAIDASGKLRPGQAMSDRVFSVDPMTGKSVFTVPDHRSNSLGIGAAANDPAYISAVQARAGKQSLPWKDPYAEQIWSAVKANRANVGSIYSSPAARAGLPTQEPTTTGWGVGSPVDPSRINQNTPTLLDVERGQWQTRPNPNMTPAAGPTPVPGSANHTNQRAQTLQRSKVTEQELQGFSGAFLRAPAPTGSPPAPQTIAPRQLRNKDFEAGAY